MGSRGQTWAVIDARAGASSEISPTDVVAGIPLLVRALRTADRLGWEGAAVLVEEAEEDEVRRLLERYPVSGSFRVESGAGAEAPADATAVELDGRGLYHADALAGAAEERAAAEPALLVKTREDARRAERELLSRIRKSVALDGVVAYYVMRPASRVLTRMLLGTRVSPNAATLASLACGLTGAAFAALGGHLGAAIAGALYFLSGVVDCVDGDLARLRLQSSKLGEWLDSAADELATFSLLAGLGVGLARDGYGDMWAAGAAWASLLGLLTVARLYRGLHQLNLPIDTAQYPWFFSGAGEGGGGAATGERGALGKLLYGLGYLVRRDANVTGVALLLVLDLRRVAAGLIMAAIVFVFLLTVVHLVVTARRRVGRGERA